jgi:hypothetical protein
MTQMNCAELPPLQESLRPGSFCAAKYCNGIWCRAIVEKVTGNQCQIFFLDYGAPLDVSISLLKQMPKNLEIYEPFAKRFCLNGAETIPKGYVHCFADIVDSQALQIKVTEFQREKNLYSCDLFIKNHSVLDMIFAFMFKEVATYKKVEISVNADYNIIIASVDSSKLPWNFHVLLEDKLPMLETLMSNMAEMCKTPPKTPQVIAPGMPIISKFNNDGQWYRATVLQSSAKEVEVHYEDYGNDAVVKHEDTYPMRCDFVTGLPTQAVLCRLQTADTVEAAGIMLEEKYSNRSYIMKVIKLLNTGEFLVKLFDNSKSPPEDISLNMLFGEPLPKPTSVARIIPAPTYDMPVPPIPEHAKPIRDAIMNTHPGNNI